MEIGKNYKPEPLGVGKLIVIQAKKMMIKHDQILNTLSNKNQYRRYERIV